MLSYCIIPGRYGEEFVEKRREKLQMWTNRIARHPVISRSDVVYHFLRCRDNDGKVVIHTASSCIDNSLNSVDGFVNQDSRQCHKFGTEFYF